jgi:hypothetical protein
MHPLTTAAALGLYTINADETPVRAPDAVESPDPEALV